MSAGKLFSIGHTCQKPFVLCIYLHDADTVTPEALDAALPGLLDSIKAEHASLLHTLSFVERKWQPMTESEGGEL